MESSLWSQRWMIFFFQLSDFCYLQGYFLGVSGMGMMSRNFPVEMFEIIAIWQLLQSYRLEIFKNLKDFLISWLQFFTSSLWSDYGFMVFRRWIKFIPKSHLVRYFHKNMNLHKTPQPSYDFDIHIYNLLESLIKVSYTKELIRIL